MKWSANEWLELANLLMAFGGILVSAFVAIWIVFRLQKQLDNDQSIKHFLVGNITYLRNNYRQKLNQIVDGKSKAKDIKSFLSSQNKEVADLMALISLKYENVDKNHYNQWCVSTYQIIEGAKQFSLSLKDNKLLKIDEDECKKILAALTDYELLTNRLILEIYE